MNKLLGEVAEVIGPIRVALGSDNAQGAQLLRDLMTNGCATDPALWLPLELYEHYLEPYISRNHDDGLWRLAPTHLYKLALEYAHKCNCRFYHESYVNYSLRDGSVYSDALKWLVNVQQPSETVESR
eukprot:13027-Heterococcus_DN1.PRE.2